MDENNFGIQIQTTFENSQQITNKLKILLEQVRKQAKSEKINLDVGIGNNEVLNSLKTLEDSIAKITASSKNMFNGIDVSKLTDITNKMSNLSKMSLRKLEYSVNQNTGERFNEKRLYENDIGNSVQVLTKGNEIVVKTTENIDKQEQIIKNKAKEEQRELAIREKTLQEEQKIRSALAEQEKLVNRKTVDKSDKSKLTWEGTASLEKRVALIQKEADALAKVKINNDRNGKISSATITYMSKDMTKVVTETMKWKSELNEAKNIMTNTFTTVDTSYSSNIEKQRAMNQAFKETKVSLDSAMKSMNGNGILSSKVLSQGNNVLNGVNPNNIKSASSMVNSLKQQEAMVLKLNKAISSYSAKYDGLKTKYGNLVPRKESNEFIAVMNKMTKARDKLVNETGSNMSNNTFKQMTNDATKLQTAMSGIAKNSSIKMITQETIGLGSALQSTFNKVMMFSGVGSVMFGVVNQFKSAVGYVNEMDKAMTNVQMITGRSKEEVVTLTDSYKRLAGEMSSTNSEMMKGSEEFLRAGYSDIETKEMLKQNLIASKISGQDQGVTSEQLIAIKNSYDMTADSISHVNDVLSTLDDTSATSYEELAKIMQYSAFSAKEVKVGFEELGTYASVISSKTR